MSIAPRPRIRCALLLVAVLARSGVSSGARTAAPGPNTGPVSPLPAYAPLRQASGAVRIWGSPGDGPLIRALAARFRWFQPRVRVLVTLHGPESTFAGVYMDVADLAFMAREIRVPLETMAFEWVHHYPPFTVQIANAGLGGGNGARRPGLNLAFFVSRSNPLSCLTLRQLDDVFAADHRRGGDDARRWGALGVQGRWADRPIHVYGPTLGNIASVFVRQTVLEGSYKWNAAYRAVRGGWRAVLGAVARDPDGIAFAPPLPGNPALKTLQVAASSRASCVALDANTAETRAYPLARMIDVALDRRPGTSLEPQVKEFLRFILSRQGQDIIARDGAYLPLSASTLRRQLRRLR